MTVRQAEARLTEWAMWRADVNRERDESVRAALASGVSKKRIYELTGIARTTLDRIEKNGASHG